MSKLLFRLTTFFIGVMPSVAFASDPFEKGTSKIEELADNLSGPIAIAFFTVAIIVVGYLLATGKMRMGLAIGIIGGAVVIASAAAIASWAFA